MRTIDAAKFKEQCLTLFDQLDAEGLIVTRHGKPVARVLPMEANDANLIGSLQHKIKIKGNTFATGLAWGSHF